MKKELDGVEVEEVTTVLEDSLVGLVTTVDGIEEVRELLSSVFGEEGLTVVVGVVEIVPVLEVVGVGVERVEVVRVVEDDPLVVVEVSLVVTEETALEVISPVVIKENSLEVLEVLGRLVVIDDEYSEDNDLLDDTPLLDNSEGG